MFHITNGHSHKQAEALWPFNHYDVGVCGDASSPEQHKSMLILRVIYPLIPRKSISASLGVCPQSMGQLGKIARHAGL